MKQIGDELVVTLKVPVADVEEDDALAGVGALAHHLNRTLMAFEQRPEVLHHRRQVHNVRERPRGQFRNQPRGQARLGRRLDYQRELRGRFRESHGGLRRGVLRSVNDVAPMNQLGKWARIETELFLRDGRQPQGARFVVRVIELAPTAVLAEVLGIGRSKKRALVVVEPPGHPRRAGVFEVHDRVLVPIEQAFLKGLRGAVRQASKLEFRARVEPLPVEAQKKGGRSGAIKAAVVEADANLHRDTEPRKWPLRLARRRNLAKTKAIKMAGRWEIVNRKARGELRKAEEAEERKREKGSRRVLLLFLKVSAERELAAAGHLHFALPILIAAQAQADLVDSGRQFERGRS